MFIARALIVSCLIQQIFLLFESNSHWNVLLWMKHNFLHFLKRCFIFLLDNETFSFCREKLCVCLCSTTQMENCSVPFSVLIMRLGSWARVDKRERESNGKHFLLVAIFGKFFRFFSSFDGKFLLASDALFSLTLYSV